MENQVSKVSDPRYEVRAFDVLVSAALHTPCGLIPLDPGDVIVSGPAGVFVFAKR